MSSVHLPPGGRGRWFGVKLRPEQDEFSPKSLSTAETITVDLVLNRTESRIMTYKFLHKGPFGVVQCLLDEEGSFSSLDEEGTTSSHHVHEDLWLVLNVESGMYDWNLGKKSRKEEEH